MSPRRETFVRRAIPFAAALALSLYAWWPMLAAYPKGQGGDGPVFHQALEAARVSVVRWHELPFWNPYQCGGLPLWDNPQGPAAAPLVWVMLVTGTTAAMVLWYVLHSAFGFLSMWIFGRRELGLERPAAFIASAVWANSGFHQQHYSGGHFAFVPFLYFPLALHLWRRAERDVAYAIGLGALVAWMMHEGAVYPLPHLALLLGAETLTRAWPPKRLVPIARAGAVVVVFAVLLSATRLLPVVDQLRAHTREFGVETDAMQLETFRDMFLARQHGRGVAGQQYVWPEYGTYHGPLLVALAVLGVAAGGAEGAWMVALMLLFVALMWGHFAPYAPWELLQGHVFPFKQMRVPSRFRVEVSLGLAAFIGLAVQRGPRLLAGARASARARAVTRAVLVTVGLLGVGDLLGVGIDWYAQCFYDAPVQPVAVSPRFHYGGPELASFVDQPRQNLGRRDCWEEWGWGVGAPLWDGDLPQARAASDADVVVERVEQTQNTYRLAVTARAPSRVLVNTVYDRQWQTDVGSLHDVAKQLVLEVPPGHHEVTLRYRPRLFGVGVALNVLGLMAAALYFRRRRAA